VAPRLLIIDDNEDLRAFIRVLAEGLGCSAVEAGNGAEGLKALAEKGPFDAALCDLYMPEMDGFQFVKAVRADPSFKGLKILMSTTATQQHLVKTALDLGADEYLMKPFTRELLLGKLQLLGLLP
jgi:two-component system, chemotaxis family, chemotaxis protein CheY